MRAKDLVTVVSNSLFDEKSFFESYASLVKDNRRDAGFLKRLEAVFQKKGRRWRKRQKMAIFKHNATQML